MLTGELLLFALLAALGTSLIVAGIGRWRRNATMDTRLGALSAYWAPRETPADERSRGSAGPRQLAARLGALVARRWPAGLASLAARVDQAGLLSTVSPLELLGWKVVFVAVAAAIGVWAIAARGAIGVAVLALGLAIGWFGIDMVLARYRATRRRWILRDLPTIMDLLVLSLEAGMGLDRALRTVVQEYRSALSDEVGRVLRDIDLGIGRGEAFERMALRVGLDELRSVSRAIVQSEELGVSLVSVMHVQSREVRLSRRRAAEAEALRAPIKMLVPVVVFILPTLFMLLLAPVGLRAAAALSGVP
jgi:tight adherence protein C